MGCDWCERPVGASHAVACPLKGYVTEPAAPSEGGTGDEIAKLRAEIARLRKTADGQIRSRVAEDIAVESAWERCGITPHWPDDEAGSVVSHAESMAMEIARLREERLTDEERKAIAFAADQSPESDFVTTSEGEWVRSVLTALLARSTPPEAKSE